VTIDVVDDDEQGQIDVASSTAHRRRRAAIAITHVRRTAAVNRSRGQWRRAPQACVPARCASPSQMPIDVASIGCDLLARRVGSSCARGAGFLCRVTGRAPRSPMLDVRSATLTDDGSFTVINARRFETWESAVARIGSVWLPTMPVRSPDQIGA
jgi:hypothetical protein